MIKIDLAGQTTSEFVINSNYKLSDISFSNVEDADLLFYFVGHFN
jgi:hypothetical protein